MTALAAATVGRVIVIFYLIIGFRCPIVSVFNHLLSPKY